MMKKAIKFRLCGKAHSLSILDFAKRLGLYNNAEVQEYRFETYFIRGLRNDDNFSADQYWLNISSKEALTLSRSSVKTIRKHVLRVLQKMITYGLCQRTTDYDRVDEEKGSWNTERKLDMMWIVYDEYYEETCSNGRLIPEEIIPTIPRVVTPRAPHPTTSDMYDKIGQLETRIGDIERMMCRQSYHSDRYARVLKFIGAQLGLTLLDPYDLPSHFEQHQHQQDDQE
ncbi:hypothetical protein Tco_1211183 [Tanacetum coccineum]